MDTFKLQGVFVLVENEYIKINFNDILYIKAEGNFVNIKTTKKQFMVLSNLTQFTKQLPNNMFVRTHKTWTINLTKIDKYTKEHIVIKKSITPLGTTYKKNILNLLTQYSIQRKIQ